MTAPVRTIAAKFTAQGSEVVQAALAKVAAAAQSATQKIAQASQVQAQGWQRSLQAAERAAYAEQAVRTRSVQQAEQAAERMAAAQIRAVSRTATMVQGQMGTTARRVAISLDQIAVAGEVTASSMRRVVSDAANVALMFGTAGPIVAAVGISGLAILNFFQNAREARKKLEEEAIAGLERMVNAGDVQGMKDRMQDIEQGTPGKGRTDALGARRSALQARRAEPNPFSNVTHTAEAIAWSVARRIEVRKEGLAIAVLVAEYERLKKAILDPANAPTTRPVTAPITSTARGGLQFPAADIRAFRDGASGTRPRDFSAGLDPRVDAALAPFAKIQPLGDPRKFAEQLNKDVAESFRNFKLPPMPEQLEWQQSFATSISMTLIDGFSAGIERAFASGSIGDGFKALSGALLSGLGGAMIDFGKAALVTSVLMAKIRAALATLNPVAGAAAAVALIAAGAALRGVASRAFGGMGRSGGGGGGGGGSGSYAGAAAASSSDSVTRLVFGNNSIGTAVGMTPRTATQIVVIGPDDPRAQRAIMELLRKAEGRGVRAAVPAGGG